MKVNKYYYPAIFHTAEDGGFWVSFPDFESILSQGDSFEEAIAAGLNFSAVLQQGLKRELGY